MREEQKMLISFTERHRELILAAERYIYRHPEIGFQEWETTAYMEEQFERLGYELTRARDIPGFYTEADSGRPGPRLLIMAELDALPCEEHPDARNGIAHACGHNAQCAALVGIAAVLKEPGAMETMCGSIRLMAVPAEELNATEFREELRRQGVIRYFSGKDEFLRRGYLKGVDLAFLFHTGTDTPYDFTAIKSLNGSIIKSFTFYGKAAHAAAGPHMGVNALYAAMLGLDAVNAIRETFRDEDHVRVHPILTSGGDAVNVIPASVTGETMVRASTLEAIYEANDRVNRALTGAAYAVGAELTIRDRPCALPERNNRTLMKIAEQCMKDLVGEGKVDIQYETEGRGGSDMGDLSAIMPTIQPKAGGASGKGHSGEYHIADPERACVNSAKAQLLLAQELLRDQAKNAYAVLAAYQPLFPSQEALLCALDQMFREYTPRLCEVGDPAGNKS